MSTTYVRTVNGQTVYAALADADSAGNSITTTYATKSEVGQVRQVPASTSSDEDKVLTVNASGTPEWVTPAAPTVDQSYNASSTNAQSGTAVAEAIAGISVDEVPDVTASDDGKVLQATYSQGAGSYAWTTPPSVDEVPAVTSGDDAKLLKATYSGGQGSYAWETVAIPTIGTITINDPEDSQNNGGNGGDGGNSDPDVTIEDE